jgi:hypothetical protein
MPAKHGRGNKEVLGETQEKRQSLRDEYGNELGPMFREADGADAAQRHSRTDEGDFARYDYLVCGRIAGGGFVPSPSN